MGKRAIAVGIVTLLVVFQFGFLLHYVSRSNRSPKLPWTLETPTKSNVTVASTKRPRVATSIPKPALIIAKEQTTNEEKTKKPPTPPGGPLSCPPLSPPLKHLDSGVPPPCRDANGFASSPAFCQRNEAKKSFLLVVVMSAAWNFAQRHAARNAWLRSRFKMKADFVASHPWKYAFLVGKPNGKSKEENVAMQRNIEIESCHFSDILQVDVMENYYNLTAKKMAAFDYVIKNHIDFNILLKTDDDCFVNIQLILEWLDDVTSKAYTCAGEKNGNYLLGGSCSVHGRPIRNSKSKWYVSPKDYPDNFFPPFCFGPGYFLSYDLVKVVASTTSGDRMENFRLEDVHTGILIAMTSLVPGNCLAHTKRVLNYDASCVNGEFPLIVMGHSFERRKYLYNSFMQHATCR